MNSSVQALRAEVLLPILIDCARRGSTITYGQLVALAKSEAPSEDYIQSMVPRFLGGALDLVRLRCESLRLPDLSAIVVSKSEGEVGAGYVGRRDVTTERAAVFAFAWSGSEVDKPSERRGLVRAGTAAEATADSGEWLFIDPGFAGDATASCGVLGVNGRATRLTFANTIELLKREVQRTDGALNLVIEAPLSIAMSQAGNPTGRKMERRDVQTRYWYVGLGCAVLLSAMHMMRAITDVIPAREVRLFEGFVTFKPSGVASNHEADVLLLRSIVLNRMGGTVMDSSELATHPSNRLVSSTAIAGMDYGVPAVVCEFPD